MTEESHPMLPKASIPVLTFTSGVKERIAREIALRNVVSRKAQME